MLTDLGGLLGAASSASATLSGGTGGTVSRLDGVAPYSTTVGIKFNVDGTIEKGTAINGGVISWTSAGVWISGGTPDNSYSVRFTNLVVSTGGDWTSEAAADDTWIALVDAQRTWTATRTTSGEKSFSCNFEVRKTAGAPPATGSTAWTFSITNLE